MEYVHNELKYAWTRHMSKLAEALQATIYNSTVYNKVHMILENGASELNCAGHEITFDDDDVD
jgi:hypothetical protein